MTKKSIQFKHELACSQKQKMLYIMGRNPDSPQYGNIDDLDPRKYGISQMFRICVGRGCSDEFGNIDDLDPELYTSDQMLWISMGRGANTEFRNIDHLDPRTTNEDEMYRISKISWSV